MITNPRSHLPARLHHALLLAVVIALGCGKKQSPSMENADFAQSPADQSGAPGLQHVAVGPISVNAPSQWSILSGADEARLRVEIRQGYNSMLERYRNSTGNDISEFSITDMKAMRLPHDCGWCILHVAHVPPQSDYYATALAEAKEKIEWCLQEGRFARVLENGLVTVGRHTVMKTMAEKKDGGRLATIVYWCPEAPTELAQLMLVESKVDQTLQSDVDRMLASFKVADGE